MIGLIGSIGQALGTVLNFIVSTITGLITIFGLVSQSFVFFNTVFLVLPQVLAIFGLTGIAVSVFLFLIDR